MPGTSTIEQEGGRGTVQHARESRARVLRARVLLVAPQPCFETRGTPLNVLQVVRVLAGAGYDVHLATYGIGPSVPVPGLTYHRAAVVPGVRTVPPGFSWRKVAMDVPLAALTWRLLSRHRFDLVHAVEEAIFFALPAARAHGVPAIYDLDSLLSQQLAATGMARVPLAVHGVRAAERAAMRRSALALTVCRALTDAVAAAGPSIPVAQVEDAPLPEALRPPDTVRLAAMRDGFALGEAPVAVYVGNLAPYQGIGLLLEAWRTVHARLPHARLLVAGGEAHEVRALRDALEGQPHGRSVVLAGARSPEELPELMALGTALVSPRLRGENTPMKVYAYMASGIPIVATDLRTHRQALDESSAVLAPAEPRAFGDALARVLAGPAGYAGRARAARQRAQADFSPEAFERKLLAAYDRVLGDFSKVTSNR